MSATGMRVVVVALAVGAAWLAAGYAFFLPLLWTCLLLATLALIPSERHLVATGTLLLLLAAAGVSWIVALDHEAAFQHMLVAFAAVLLFGLARWSRPDDGAVSVMSLLIAGTAITAIAQVTGTLDAAARHVSALAPGWREVAAERLAIGRAFGTAALPAHFAILLVCVAPLLVARALRARGAARAVWWLGAAATVAGVVTTRSLAAIAVAAALALLAASRGASRRAVWLTGGALAAAALAVAALRTDLAAAEPLRLRWINWRTTAWVFAHHPWTGVGLGGVGQAGLAAPTGSLNATPYAHCTPLQLLAELGLGGAGLLVIGAVSLVWLIRQGLRVEPALALSVAAVPLHNLVDFSLYAPEVLLPWAVLTGALAGRCLPAPRRPTSAFVLVPLLAVGALAATAGWRGEALASAAQLGPRTARVAGLTAAARWQPWAVTPLLTAAEAAWLHPDPSLELSRLAGELADRAWVRPRSPAWAEAMARLRLAEGRPAEALPFALEASARAPWRNDLVALVGACRGSG